MTPTLEGNIITLGEDENKNLSSNNIKKELENQQNNTNNKNNNNDDYNNTNLKNLKTNNYNNLENSTSNIKNENKINAVKESNLNIDFDDISENSNVKGNYCDIYDLKNFIIDPTTFYLFYNKILNCNILFKKKDSNKVNTLESDYSEKNKLDDSIEFYSCCICFVNTNEIILDCGVIILNFILF